jgi:hypothetical protein
LRNLSPNFIKEVLNTGSHADCSKPTFLMHKFIVLYYYYYYYYVLNFLKIFKVTSYVKYLVCSCGVFPNYMVLDPS